MEGAELASLFSSEYSQKRYLREYSLLKAYFELVKNGQIDMS